jgi:2,3-bisphosphoglycerate-independent phosphoglycerate mutase
MEPVEKFIVLIGDGMGDEPMPEFEQRTALEAARIPTMDYLARTGELGLLKTIPDGMPLGSDVANMSLMGYDPGEFYTGRGPLEAAAMDIDMNPEDVAFRCNLVTLSFREGRVYMDDYSAGHISTEEAHKLVEDLAQLVASRSFELIPGVSYRHLLLWRGGPEGLVTFPPHDYTNADVTEAWHIYEDEPLLYEVLKKAITFFHRHPVNEKRKERGLNVANSIWLWGQGRKPVMPTLTELYGIKGSVIAAVDLIKGLGKWAGLEEIEVRGATGFLDTNYRGKADAALNALEEQDFVFLHVEAPDEAGHMGNAREKVRAIENFDREVVTPIFDGMKKRNIPFRMLVVTDHYTPVSIRTHAAGPVPFIIYDSRKEQDSPDRSYSEKAAAETGLNISQGHHIIPRLLEVPPPEKENGDEE